jgi:hypothetical protein
MADEALQARKLTDIEREAIVLNAVLGMIDDMVNHAIFMPLGENSLKLTCCRPRRKRFASSARCSATSSRR